MSLTRSDWILLVLATSGGNPMKKVDFQKALFLIGKLLSEDVGPGFFPFIPHKYGPFSKSAYDEAEHLVVQNLVIETQQEFTAAQDGLEQAATLQTNAVVSSVVTRVVAWVRKQPFEVLCRQIYQQFPEMKENSVLELLPPDPEPMHLVEWFDALDADDRTQLDRAASLGKTTGGDLDLELAFSGKDRHAAK